MPGRNYAQGNKYRYGFNGKENDNDVKGEGNQQDYGMRIYDTRLARFLSVDPLQKKYPWYTPYQFSGNTPIQATDLDGLEEIHYTLTFNKNNQPQLKYEKRVEEKTFLFFFTYKPTETTVINYKGETYEFTAGGYSTSPMMDMGANSYEYLNAWLSGGYKQINFDQAFYSTYAKNLLDAGEIAEGVSTEINVGKAWAKANAHSLEESTPNAKTNKQATAANNGNLAAAEANTAKASSATKSTPITKNLNNNDAKGNFVLYEIRDGNNILKIGKANADDVMADGSIRRVHTSERLAIKAGYENAKAYIVEKLGQTTTAEAKKAEATRVRAARAKGQALPLNKERDKSYYN